MHADLDPAALMGPVARALLGEPNPALSRPFELRFGSRGSLAVDLNKGLWHDHEAHTGGGVFDLIRRETGLSNGAAFDWMRKQGLVADAPQRYRASDRQPRGRIVATYDYRDEAGALLFQVCRLDPKDFRQRAPDGRGGWTWSTRDVRRVLYRLPELLATPPEATVLIVEGEKDADRLAALGLVATTNPGGARAWRDAFADALAGRRCAIIADNDDAGRAHAAQVRASLDRKGVRCTVLELPSLPPKGDASDWLDAGGDPADLARMAAAALDAPTADEPPALAPTPFVLRDTATLPPRRWLYDRHLIAGFASLTVSPGGLGKSSMVLVEALAMVTGRALLGAAPPRPLRVWYWNGEDPRDEIERRVAAACAHYGITATDLGDRLHTDSGRDVPIALATMGKAGVLLARPAVEAMVSAITTGRIDVLVIDPFVTSHAVPENDNGAVNAVVALWREIADRTGCAVELVHHAQKAAINAGSEIGMAQSRGASALIDGVRSARYLVAMTAEEARRAGIETHRGFFRVEMGKANLAPLPDQATWRRLVSVDLFNGTDDYPGGDRVGVVVPWEWPDAFDGVRVQDLEAVKARLASGVWKASEQADEWAGHAVAAVLGIDAGPAKKGQRTPAQNAARAKVRELLKTWKRTGEVVEVIRTDPQNRRSAPFIEPAGGCDE